ncbi:MAG: tRNA preQ1(34) S-adenosylmethionine ribosyltransferase-isomerase QueA [Chloroflexi bacterium RBG_19FT_COMBO_49_13]|nr:MAG: tRNA preQ1(34) S-adenosylmethionine ribosyltransferase-isomerase QueA [Chloroflexi bacterium RBG_19FT_COMBO_49_13]
MRTADFDYELPAHFIAQVPLERRDQSRLFILNRQSGIIEHAMFMDLGNYLKAGDVLVVNETRVIPGRLFARKIPGGGRVEILLLRKRDERTWEALVGGKGLTMGKQIQVESSKPGEQTPLGEIIEVLDGSERLILFDRSVESFFPDIGHVPLPPYIHNRLDDPERYQTVYAKNSGSAAAPTAGLHFTPQLIDQLIIQGILFATVTLHVGLDTFAPVNEVDPLEHKIHSEWCQIAPTAVERINQARNSRGRVIAVGTTSVRTLESATENGRIKAFEGPTNLFILPGYKFRMVDAMITNFHLPRSTLIMLVSAFAGREKVMHAYEIAKQSNYRFYSFGDAMLII